ncbi:MAG: hypothetical protein RIC19_03920 [Phaeodactylibacter sp.]|uniref:hypothetical protein n=1 Tax=Phaeodactylibacter sp. TaxID=1940289 RepID=UPI0032EFFD30
MMLRIFLLCSLLFASASSLRAQDGEAERYPFYIQIGGHFAVLNPVEGFREALDKNGIGGGGQVLFQIGPGRPVFAGLDFSVVRFDEEVVSFTTTQNGFAENYELRTRSNMLLGHVLLRFKPFTGFFLQPYADGLLGLRRPYTRTKYVQLFDEGEEELIEAYPELNDNTFSAGLGAGVQARLSARPDILLDARCTYVMGGSARYLVRMDDPPAVFDDPIEVFEERITPTTALQFQIGITLQLGL